MQGPREKEHRSQETGNGRPGNFCVLLQQVTEQSVLYITNSTVQLM